MDAANTTLPPPPSGYAVDDALPPPPTGYALDAPSANDDNSAQSGPLSRYAKNLADTTGIPQIINAAKNDAAKQPPSSPSLWDSVKQGVKRSITDSPPATAYRVGKGILQQQGEQLGEGWDAAKQGDYSSAVGHTVAGLLPVVGPMAAKAGEQIGSGDVAGGLGTATGAVGQVVLPSVLKGVRGARVAAADSLDQSAVKSYSRAMGPTTKANKFLTEKTAPELIDRGVMAASRKGLQSTASKNLQSVGQQIGDAFDNLPPGEAVPLDAVTARLDQSANDAMTAATPTGPKPLGPLAERGLYNVQELKNTLASFAEDDPQTGQKVIPIDRVRKVRQYFDSVAAKSGRYEGKSLADETAAEAHGMAADAIREELAQKYPDIAKLNQEYSFWKNVHKVVSDTITRTSSQSLPLGEQLATAAGGSAGLVAGGVHGAALGASSGRVLLKLFRSPLWQTTSAVAKSHLADLIATGNEQGIAKFSQALSAIGTSQAPEKVGPTRSFPAAGVAAFSQQNGITEDQARQKLAAEGWTIQ